MPLFEGLSAGSEKNAVILDVGAAYSKVGFSGEYGPWTIIPSKVKLTGTNKEISIMDYNTTVELHDILVDFFHKLYFKHLLVNPRDRRVVFCESILCPTHFRETVAKVLFKHYEVPSVLFIPSHLVALNTLGVSSALVFDSGYTETTVLPIFEGFPIIKGVMAVPLAGSALHKNIGNLLRDQAFIVKNGEEKPLASIMPTLPEDLLEDIKVRTCFVTNMERAKSIQTSLLQGDETKWPSPPASVDYPLDGGSKLLINGKIREMACEVLFEQDNEEQSVTTIILDSILQCPIDMRKHLASNLVLMGGSTMLPGFAHRLLAELRELQKKPKYKKRCSALFFKVHSPPAEANYTAWLGGAILGAMEILPYRSLTKETYNSIERVPDWCSLNNAIQEAEVMPKEKTPRRQLPAIRNLSLNRTPLSPLSSSST